VRNSYFDNPVRQGSGETHWQTTMMHLLAGPHRDLWLQPMRSFVVAGGLALMVSGCVSSNLGSVDTQSASAVPSPHETPPAYDPLQRAQAVAEIRQKSARPSGELTHAFASGDGPGETLDKAEQTRLITELEQAAAENSNAVSDAELTERQNAIRALQAKAKSHYKNALNTIEN